MKDMKCTVLVPKIDRQGIEFPRIPCKVVRVLENGFYELVCSAGALVNKYRDEDLMALSGKLVEPTKLDKITLRQAEVKNCSNGYCNCKKNGSHCSSHCTCNKKNVKT